MTRRSRGKKPKGPRSHQKQPSNSPESPKNNQAIFLDHLPDEILIQIFDSAAAVGRGASHRQRAMKCRIVHSRLSLVCKRFRSIAFEGVFRFVSLCVNGNERQQAYTEKLLLHSKNFIDRVRFASIESSVSYLKDGHPPDTALDGAYLDVCKLLYDMRSGVHELRLGENVFGKALAHNVTLPKLKKLTVHFCKCVSLAEIIDACPALVSVHVNVTTEHCTFGLMEEDFPQQAFEAMGRLNRLQTFEMFKFGYMTHHFVEGAQRYATGWTPDDIRFIHKHVPDITQLSLYGNLNHETSLKSLISPLSSFKHLQKLLVTDECVSDWGFLNDTDYNDPTEKEEYELSSKESTPENRAAATFALFQACPELRELSLVWKADGVTYKCKTFEMEIGGRKIKSRDPFKSGTFTNSYFAVCVYGDFRRLPYL